MPSITLDLGLDHTFTWTSWKPDRSLNPVFKDIPDEDRYGAYVTHRTKEGERCDGGIVFVTPTRMALDRLYQEDNAKWLIINEDPLTIEPSLLCRMCGDHGFIREGKWVPA